MCLRECDLLRLLSMCPSLKSLSHDFTNDINTPVLPNSINAYTPFLQVVHFTGSDAQLRGLLPALRTVREVRLDVRDDYQEFSYLDNLHVPHDAIKANITYDISLRSRTSVRSLTTNQPEEVTWILTHDTIVKNLQFMIIDIEDWQLPLVPMAEASSLHTLALMDPWLEVWPSYTFRWSCPILHTLAMAALYEVMDDTIDCGRLSELLRNMFGFSNTRRLPRLVIRNMRLTEDRSELESLVVDIDVADDDEWEPEDLYVKGRSHSV